MQKLFSSWFLLSSLGLFASCSDVNLGTIDGGGAATGTGGIGNGGTTGAGGRITGTGGSMLGTGGALIGAGGSMLGSGGALIGTGGIPGTGGRGTGGASITDAGPPDAAKQPDLAAAKTDATDATGTCSYNGTAHPVGAVFQIEDLPCYRTCECISDGVIGNCTPDCLSRDGGGDVSLDSTTDMVAAGCDLAVAKQTLADLGYTMLMGQPQTINDTVPSPIDGPDWGLKSSVCSQGGYDISSLAGKTVCLFQQGFIKDCSEMRFDVWIVMVDGATKCVYEQIEDQNPGLYPVGGYCSARPRG